MNIVSNRLLIGYVKKQTPAYNLRQLTKRLI
ncbi:hypothetical protein EMIT0P2_20619 [Pseudomonas sp. IT-P2]